MKIFPEHSFLLVALDRPRDRTPAGLVIPDSARYGLQLIIGKVILAGPGKYLESGERLVPDVKPGDLVSFRVGTDFIPLEVGVNSAVTNEDGKPMPIPRLALVQWGFVVSKVELDDGEVLDFECDNNSVTLGDKTFVPKQPPKDSGLVTAIPAGMQLETESPLRRGGHKKRLQLSR